VKARPRPVEHSAAEHIWRFVGPSRYRRNSTPWIIGVSADVLEPDSSTTPP
jgi:hypothetical protein